MACKNTEHATNGKKMMILLTQVCELLDVQIESGTPPETLKQVSHDSAKNFCDAAEKVTGIPVPDACEMMKRLTASQFQDDNRSNMLASINAMLNRQRLPAKINPSDGKQPFQFMSEFHKYMSKQCRDVLLDRKSTLRMKGGAVIDNLSDLGAMYLSELSLAKVLCSWLLIEYGNSLPSRLTPLACYTQIKAMRKLMVSRRKKFKQNHYGEIIDFPSYPTWQFQADPTQCVGL